MATAPSRPPACTPVKKIQFAFPFRKASGDPKKPSSAFTDQHDFLRLLRKEPGGAYAVSREGLWHGGIHITDTGAGASLDLKHGVRCMADGEVVAWRVNRKYLSRDIPAFSAQYSTGFTLVRHVMEFPKDCTLTFFSLYMHLQDLAGYEADRTLRRPAYWTTWFKVAQGARDQQDAAPRGMVAAPAAQVGLRVRATKPGGAILGILPRGAQFSLIKREGDWGQIEAVHVGAMVAPKIGGYVASTAAQKGWVYLGREGGAANAEAFVPETALDRVIVPPKPVSIKAGDLIGHLGRYDSIAKQTAARMVHLEMFCDGGVLPFIEKCRSWIIENAAHPAAWQQLGLSPEPTILRIDRQTTLYKRPHQEGRDAPMTDVVQAYTLAELERRAEKPFTEAEEGTDRKKLRWWKIESADPRRQDISGWVREENFAGGRISREFAQKWVDFEVLQATHDPTHTIFATTTAYIDYITDADIPNTGALAKLSPLMQTVCRQLYTRGNGQQAANDLCVAAHDPWAAMRASRLIVKHESEWANPGKWRQLTDEIGKKRGDREALEAEHKRIETLTWWDEVKAQFPALPNPQVFHIHPIGIVGNFFSRFRFTLPMLRRLFPAAEEQVLADIAAELNDHIELYRLDTPLRRSHFFAQIMQETGASVRLEEGFVWKASALIETFSYFKRNPALAKAHGYADQRPIKEDGTAMTQADFEAIANGAYGGQKGLGNGGVGSGDGWKYRGRGLKHLTGRYNYGKFTKWHRANQSWWPDDKVDFELSPDLLLHPKYAARSAAFFWVSSHLAELADKGCARKDVDAITEVINAETNSYLRRFNNFMMIWGEGLFI
ncbi:glycoside hydrolase family 19 protein [Cupriavidus campinensis]